MRKKSQRVQDNATVVDADRIYSIKDGVEALKESESVKFDETVEIAMNLFSEVSVLREWGVAGGQPKAVIQCFGNLREASKMADRYRTRAERRGYLRH